MERMERDRMEKERMERERMERERMERERMEMERMERDKLDGAKIVWGDDVREKCKKAESCRLKSEKVKMKKNLFFISNFHRI